MITMADAPAEKKKRKARKNRGPVQFGGVQQRVGVYVYGNMIGELVSDNDGPWRFYVNTQDVRTDKLVGIEWPHRRMAQAALRVILTRWLDALQATAAQSALVQPEEEESEPKDDTPADDS